MSNLKGAELAADVKEINKDTGVILITGYMDKNKNIIGNNEFIDSYVSKPLELAVLSETIKKY